MVTPSRSTRVSSGWTVSSKPNLYWKPEQPPPSTDRRSLSAALPCRSMSVAIRLAAASDRATVGCDIVVVLHQPAPVTLLVQGRLPDLGKMTPECNLRPLCSGSLRPFLHRQQVGRRLQARHRVQRPVFKAHFVVQVGAGGAPAAAHQADHRAGGHPFTGAGLDGGEVAVRS